MGQCLVNPVREGADLHGVEVFMHLLERTVLVAIVAALPEHAVLTAPEGPALLRLVLVQSAILGGRGCGLDQKSGPLRLLHREHVVFSVGELAVPPVAAEALFEPVLA